MLKPNPAPAKLLIVSFGSDGGCIDISRADRSRKSIDPSAIVKASSVLYLRTSHESTRSGIVIVLVLITALVTCSHVNLRLRTTVTPLLTRGTTDVTLFDLEFMLSKQLLRLACFCCISHVVSIVYFPAFADA